MHKKHCHLMTKVIIYRDDNDNDDNNSKMLPIEVTVDGSTTVDRAEHQLKAT